MTSIDTVTLEVADPSDAHDFYTAAFGPDIPVRVRAFHGAYYLVDHSGTRRVRTAA